MASVPSVLGLTPLGAAIIRPTAIGAGLPVNTGISPPANQGPVQKGPAAHEPAQYYSPRIREKFDVQITTNLSTSVENTKYADISYAFDERAYAKRTQARLQAGGLLTTLPHGWPKVLRGPLVWTGSDFPDQSVFCYDLTDQDKEEITAALAHFKTLEKDGKDANRESFPLPGLQKKLLRIRDDVYQGRGFATLRGLDVHAFSDVDLLTVYLGLSSYVAEVRGKQNHKGSMLIHVVNTTEAIRTENATVEMPFHTDLVCDVVSTLTKSCGGSGGSAIVASAWTVYNELAATRPDLIHVLAEPNWPFDTFMRDPPFYNRALLYLQDGKVITNFSRRCLVGHAATGPRTPGIPGLTEAQAEALDALHAIGRRHELRTAMRAGDVRFVNNMGLMHRRNPYQDDEEMGLDQRRHLLRLWLHNPESCWAMPAPLRLAWERIFRDPERDGRWDLVRVDEEGRMWDKPVWKEVGHEEEDSYRVRGSVTMPPGGIRTAADEDSTSTTSTTSTACD
ncbi:hypothetical protein B0H67DRAFT_93173 [Lasiosphaeris hirsuta]|uniref:TauD/TfdA-like domain-containing protein n=1 Tax=Lasiosphaeris hirsuta TaxID=260670 RepID=A0AA40BD41_9PEZI|nr:hypothetical protein B0H67DRAFT_93173 [Lasiosphaeris hirsuta]